MIVIDYDKLKIVSELCCSTDRYYFDIALGMHDGLIALFDADNTADQFICNPESLDDLITKLKTLIQPEPKYKNMRYEPRDKVWRLNDEYLPHEFVINGRSWEDQILYLEISEDDGEMWWLESELYPTKAQLIEAQITHWQSMLSEELEQHVSDYCSPKFEGQIQGFKSEPDPEYCNVSGARLGKREECEHEPNEHGYFLSDPIQFLCKKCGEFYR
jgi:hypothetical protein